MSRLVRPFLVFAVCGFALACSACSSNNEGKIIGKWKMTSAPSGKSTEEFDSMSKIGLYFYFEFRADKTFELGIGADKPEKLELVKQAVPGQKVSWAAKYKLRSGDRVEIYDLPQDLQTEGGGFFGKGEKGGTNVKINGDNMTFKDADGTTGKLTRIK